MLLKKKKKKEWGAKQSQRAEVFSYNAGYLSLHNHQTCSVCSSPPSTVLLPFSGGGVRGGKACMSVCVQEEWPRDVENLWRGGKKTKPAGFFFFYVCACFFLKSSKSKPQLKMYICQSWANSDIKCQRARWNTDEVPPRFPRLFLNRCCGLLLYYTSSAERHEKKKKKE